MALPDFPGKLKNTSGPDLKLIHNLVVVIKGFFFTEWSEISKLLRNFSKP